MIRPPRPANDLQTRILGSLVRQVAYATSYSERLAVLDAVAAQAAGHVREGHIDRGDALIALVNAALANGIIDYKAGPIVSRHLAPKPPVLRSTHKAGA